MHESQCEFQAATTGGLRTWFAKAETVPENETALRIGGIISTGALDRQAENVLVDGLVFHEFLSFGWFNDNHKKGVLDVLGYPTDVMRIKPGDKLPDDTVSKVHGWWAGGFLLDTPKCRELHTLIKAVEKIPERQYGFSIEGKIHERQGTTIRRASIRNVAITHVPVNPETSLATIAKALVSGDPIAAAGTAAQPGDASALRTESLETHPTVEDWVASIQEFLAKPWNPTLSKSMISKEDARQYVRRQRPDLTTQQIDNIIEEVVNANVT